MRRFLLSERNPPPYYRVDSSTPSQWMEAVYSPAEAIVEALLEGRLPEQQPLSLNHKSTELLIDERKTLHCDICNREFKGSRQFRAHKNSKSHRKLENGKMEHYELVVILEKFPPESR